MYVDHTVCVQEVFYRSQRPESYSPDVHEDDSPAAQHAVLDQLQQSSLRRLCARRARSFPQLQSHVSFSVPTSKILQHFLCLHRPALRVQPSWRLRQHAVSEIDTHTQAHTPTHTHPRPTTHTRTHPHINTHPRTPTQITHTPNHTQIHTHTYTHTPNHTQTPPNTYTQTHAQPHTDTHRHRFMGDILETPALMYPKSLTNVHDFFMSPLVIFTIILVISIKNISISIKHNVEFLQK